MKHRTGDRRKLQPSPDRGRADRRRSQQPSPPGPLRITRWPSTLPLHWTPLRVRVRAALSVRSCGWPGHRLRSGPSPRGTRILAQLQERGVTRVVPESPFARSSGTRTMARRVVAVRCLGLSPGMPARTTRCSRSDLEVAEGPGHEGRHIVRRRCDRALVPVHLAVVSHLGVTPRPHRRGTPAVGLVRVGTPQRARNGAGSS